MILLIISLPILGCLISGLLGRHLGFIISKWIATLCIIIPCILSYIIFYQILINGHIYKLLLGNWINIDYINIDWGFIIDELSISLLVPICTISSLVHLYSISYMSHDPHQQRFFSILSLFTAFMIILVTGNNYLVMFVGWEFIGVASYLLISHWYTRINAIKSGLNALLVNKFGDMLLTIGLYLILFTFGTFNYNIINSLTVYINTDIITLIMLCLLIGAMAKSAQLGLHTWLLNSMEGPTPVSSLLHAACLVCAGIYLLLRSSYLLEYTSIVLLIILWIGGLTTIIAGIIAIVSNDIKKIIALSTMSQLGLMVVAIGCSNYNIGLYHLFTHAMFKALLFMSAGSIIHSIVYESQDIRNYGGIIHYMPITYSCLLIASLSLMALPGLSGYYSKDLIIETVYSIYTISGYTIYWFSVISATLTTLYSIRMLYLIFINTPNNNKYSYNIINESSYIMLIPMIILAIMSIFIGYITRDIYVGMGSSFNSLLIHPNNLNIIETEFALPIFYKLLPLILTILGTLFILFIYEYIYNLLPKFNNNIFYNIYYYINSKFMLDQLLNNVILRSSLLLGIYNYRYIDKGLLHILGPTNISNILNNLSYNITYLSSHPSNIRHYTIYLLILLTLLSILIIYTNYLLLILFLLTIWFYYDNNNI